MSGQPRNRQQPPTACALRPRLRPRLRRGSGAAPCHSSHSSSSSSRRDKPGFDGIPSSGHLIPNPANPTEPVRVQCGAADHVCKSGGGVDLFASHFAPGANDDTYPYGPQGDQYSLGRMKDVPSTNTSIKMVSAEQLPVKYAISESFGVFNKYFTSVPSASWPNHMFAQSATSCGVPTNEFYSDCCKCSRSLCVFLRSLKDAAAQTLAA